MKTTRKSLRQPKPERRPRRGGAATEAVEDLRDVTLRLQRDQIAALQNHVVTLEQQLRAPSDPLSDVHPVACIELSGGGIVRRANAAAVKLLGKPLLMQGFGSFVVSAERQSLFSYVRQCFHTTKPNERIETELTIETRSGVVVPVRLVSIVDCTRLNESFIRVALIDLTETRGAERWLALREKNYQTLIETLDGIVWEAEFPLRYTFVSRQAEKILGRPAEEWLRNPRFWENHVHIDDRDRAVRLRHEAVRHQQPHVLEYRMHSIGRGIVWLRDSAIVTRTPQGHTYLKGLIINITDLKEAEQKLRAAHEKVGCQAEEHKRHLEQTVQSMEAFCYGIAHELRAPVRAMSGFSNLLIPQLDDKPEASEFARRISRASLYMDQLIQDLLAYGRLHHTDLVKMAVEVRSMIERLIPIIGETTPLRDAHINVAPNFPRVLAHPALLSQAMENLLANALKFKRRGVTPEISIHGEERGEIVRIVVVDNGVGIDPEYQGKIFGVFQRAHSAEEYPGTGIGLAIVKRAVELMDGRVGVESAPGKGSRFWIELPKATEQAIEQARHSPQPEQIMFIPPPAPAPLPREIGGG